MKGKLIFGFFFVFILSCGGGDDGPPPAPEGSLLIFPEQDSECTTGVSITETQSQVTFQWQVAKNTDRYTLTVINLSSNSPQSISTSATSATLSIEKGAPFSWSVVSSNTSSDDTAISETWLFYNAGSQTTYAPFPAQIQFPVSGSSNLANNDGQIELSWIGADVENDISTFEIYFSETNPPTLLQSVTSNITQIAVDVSSGTTYYWKVISIDDEGNTSDSGVFDFKIL